MKAQPKLRSGLSLGNATAQPDATSSATNAQPTSLKALAGKVLERNQQRNSCATETEMSATPPATPPTRIASAESGADLGDLHMCAECRRLSRTGTCLAAAAGDLSGVWRRYSPVRDIRVRCPCFVLPDPGTMVH